MKETDFKVGDRVKVGDKPKTYIVYLCENGSGALCLKSEEHMKPYPDVWGGALHYYLDGCWGGPNVIKIDD